MYSMTDWCSHLPVQLIQLDPSDVCLCVASHCHSIVILLIFSIWRRFCCFFPFLSSVSTRWESIHVSAICSPVFCCCCNNNNQCYSCYANGGDESRVSEWKKLRTEKKKRKKKQIESSRWTHWVLRGLLSIILVIIDMHYEWIYNNSVYGKCHNFFSLVLMLTHHHNWRKKRETKIS